MSHPDQVVVQEKPDRRIVVAALGVTQILAWGSTFYLLGVLANPIARDTGWGYDWVISGVSVGLLTAGAVSPRVGRAIGKWGGRRALALSAVLLAGGLLLLGTSQSIAWYLAEYPRNPVVKSILLDMARSWTRLAIEAEQTPRKKVDVLPFIPAAAPLNGRTMLPANASHALVGGRRHDLGTFNGCKRLDRPRRLCKPYQRY
jgi:hypothetical protein